MLCFCKPSSDSMRVGNFRVGYRKTFSHLMLSMMQMTTCVSMSHLDLNHHVVSGCLFCLSDWSMSIITDTEAAVTTVILCVYAYLVYDPIMMMLMTC